MERNPQHLHRRGQTALAIGIVAGCVVLLALAFAGYVAWSSHNSQKSFDTGGQAAGSGSQVYQAPAQLSNVPTGCNVVTAQAVSAVDAFSSTTSVAGTDNIKNGNDVPVSSLTNPTAGATITYWKNNATYFCKPISKTQICGSDTMQEQCYQNGTATVSVYDQDNRATLSNSATAGTTNLTVGANEVHNLEYDFQGVGNKANFPFGGCLAIEYPSTMSPPTIGSGLDGSACPYTWTYTPASTSNTYKLYAIPAGWDVDTTSGNALRKAVTFQMKSTGTNPSGVVYITGRGANYYAVSAGTNKGTFALDLEQSLNSGSTTQTMPGQIQTVFAVN